MRYRPFRNRIERQLRSELQQRTIPGLPGNWRETARRRDGLPPHPQRGPDERTTELLPIELLWCYWMEESGLVQAMHAICLRFENRAVGRYQALARLDLSPLRPLAELIYGYIRDETVRLSVRRRAYEYSHELGLRLVGRAVGQIDPADDRSQFLSAFHQLLNACVRFYCQVDNLMVQQDPRPVLAKLKELHRVLADGAHNQFGDLPFEARREMTVIQRILEFPEFREFLGGRIMVPYPAVWMDRVDTMRRMMRWGDASITDFWNLAECGERILLVARWGPYAPNQVNAPVAEAFALALRDDIVQYITSYQAVTGVDLGAQGQEPVDTTQPSVYLHAREARALRTG